MYQTENEKTYVTGANTFGELGQGNTSNVNTPTLVTSNGEGTYGIGAGYYNTYIIENSGNVYAAGLNEYGSIGNGTRDDHTEYTLVGDRNFKVEPENKTMKVGDVEEITIKGEAFNVFGDNKMSNNQYEWNGDNEAAIKTEIGKLTAIGEGTAHITIKDKVTGENVVLTRIVLPQEKDRIAKIKVNGIEAILDETATGDKLVYKVQVVTNENTGKLEIGTNDLTDRISVDEGANWSYNGTLNQEINIPNKITEFNIKVGIENNEGDYPVEEEYTLIVEKITDDVGIKKITATSKDDQGNVTEIEAKPVSLTRYEVAVEENTDISIAKVIANSGYSYISIDGEEYSLYEQSKDINMGYELTKEVKIAVKSEAGKEAEYTLVIYKKSALLELISLKVNNNEAKKISEGVYAITLDKTVENAHIEGTVSSNLGYVSIAGNEFKNKVNTKDLKLETDTSIVTIKTKTEDGQSKEYTLYIYRENETQITPKLDMLLVNGNVLLPEVDGLTYIAYLPSAETQAEIRAIAKENTIKVKIADNKEELGESQRAVSVSKTENIYNVVLTGEDGETATYRVIIRKAEADTNLQEVYVSYGDTEVKANKISKTNYTVKIKGNISEVDVTAITAHIKSKVQVADTGTYVEHTDTKKVTIGENKTIVKIKVQSEDGTNEEEYTLTIEKMSNNTDLEKVTVDGELATLGEDGKYHYILTDAKTSVQVGAYTKDKAPVKAYVNIENTAYALYEISKQVDINAKQTEVPIRVKAEDGTIKEHTLVIEGLPDDTSIKEVVVNGEKATYIEGKNRYEIRSDAATFDIEVTLNDLLASMKLRK